MIIESADPYRSTTNTRFWAAPIFAGTLGAILIVSFFAVRPHSYEPTLSVFFCFLPMAFFFSAAAQSESQKHIRALQQRVAQLEAQTALL